VDTKFLAYSYQKEISECMYYKHVYDSLHITKDTRTGSKSTGAHELKMSGIGKAVDFSEAMIELTSKVLLTEFSRVSWK
jgi:hypothetical protein